MINVNILPDAINEIKRRGWCFEEQDKYLDLNDSKGIEILSIRQISKGGIEIRMPYEEPLYADRVEIFIPTISYNACMPYCNMRESLDSFNEAEKSHIALELTMYVGNDLRVKRGLIFLGSQEIE